MEYIVKGLLEVDEKAKKIIDKAIEARKDYPKAVEEKKKAITAKIELDLQNDMKKINAQSLKTIEGQKKQLEESFHEKLSLLEKNYEINHKDWENQIVQKVLNSFKE